MKKKLEIIQRHLAGDTNRQIARDVGLNRKTVDKYVREWREAQAAVEAAGGSDPAAVREAVEAMTGAPAYRKRVSPPRKWTKEMDESLDAILAAEEDKRTRLRTSKQQLTKKQIHEAMVAEGHDIGLTTVCRKIAERRRPRPEAFIAQAYEYGDRFEYDFGEVHLELGGKFTKLFMAVMVACASGYRYALLYDSQRADVFADSQVRFFEHMGGCFREGVYDNMRNVVSKFVGRSEKELSPALLRLAAYYGFRVNVTNCYAGNEKGTVESAVKAVRNAAFASDWQFADAAAAQAHLDAVLAEMNAGCPVEDERAALSPRRPPYEVADIRPGALVDKYSCVRVDKVSYSVPDYLVGARVTVKAYPGEVVVLAGGEEVARHARSREAGAMVLELSHYLRTLVRKPGALARSEALAASAALKEVFDSDYAGNPREFVAVLTECAGLPEEETIAALRAHAAPPPHGRGGTADDRIAEQAVAQMRLIGAIGRSAA